MAHSIVLLMSPPSYGSITPPSAESNNSIHNGDGSTTSPLRQSSRFSLKATYSANSIVFLFILTTIAIFFAGSIHNECYNSLPLLRSSSKNIMGGKLTTSKKYKTLYLLRHAKSSWVNSSNINDYDRQLSPKGRAVAHIVGKSLNRQDVDLPDIILASSSVRTRETLALVMAAWKMRTFDESKILYSKSWYDLSDEGYFNHLVDMLSGEEDIIEEKATGGSTSNATSKHILSNVNTIMIVGHNPAIERLLNELILSSTSDKAKEWEHYFPGHFYAVRFPTLERWSDLGGGYISEEGRRGVVELHLPE